MATLDVGAVEKELNALWQKAGGEEDDAIGRACMHNLIVYVPGASERRRVEEIVADVTAASPSRAIIVIAERDAAEPSIEAEVTSRCTLPTGSSKQVCCEEVTIRAGGARVNEVPSAVVPLLVSDLPVYLWWYAVPRLLDRVFSRLADIADRVIIDSAEFADPHGDIISLSVLLRDRPRWTAFSDLNWARLTAWRALLASFYDVAQYRPLLAELDRVEIEYSPPAGDRSVITARAVLLAGWLASRLGWQLEPEATTRDEGSTTVQFNNGGRKATVALTATSSADVGPRHIVRVTLGSAADRAAAFNVRRSTLGNRIETEFNLENERQIKRVLSYDTWSESALLARELEIVGHDRVYETSVMMAGEIIVSLV